MSYYDVLVIGGGPAGSRTAYKLANAGYRVAVFEKREQVGHKLSCTGIIGRECFDLFDIDRNCVLQEAKSAKLFAPSGEFLRVSKADPQAYIVDRIAFDRSLARRARDEGAQYFLSSPATDISISARGVELFVSEDRFNGKIVVIASGFASGLPQKLGMGEIRNLITGAQAEVESRGITETEVYFSHRIAPGFFAWLVPISEHRARVGLFARQRPGAHLRQLLAELTLAGKVVPAEADIKYGGIPLKPLPKTLGERVLVVGDAAGQVKPTTGGGIYYGLLCADFAAETIEQASKANDFSPKRLAYYENLWKKKLGQELKIDYFARRFYNRLSDKRINTMFNIVRDNNIHETLLNSSYQSFDWHGQLVLDSLKQLGPWRNMFGRYLPAYILDSIRGKF